MKNFRSMVATFTAGLIGIGCATVHAGTTLLYVSNPYPSNASNVGKVTAFDPAASGSTTPLISISQPTGAWSLGFDSAAQLYSQYFLSPPEVYIYPVNANGNALPTSSFVGYERDATGIAVDSQGYIYIAAGTNTGTGYLSVYAPGATSPSSMIDLRAYVDGVTVDNNDNVIVSTWSRYNEAGDTLPGNALEVFAPRLAGGAPTRIIAGSLTGLDPLQTDTGNTGFKVSFSKLSGRIYAGISGGPAGTSRVTVFDSHANGNTAPLRTISGPATGLKAFIHGVAGNPVTGEIFVLSHDVNGGPGVITVYPQLAAGNAAPTRTITDASTQFVSSLDIAFSPPPVISINAGGAASSNFVADGSFTGGTAITWTNTVDTSLLAGNLPPQNVLQSDREGNFSYTLSGFAPNSVHSVTAYFVENYFTTVNKRVFSLTANGAPLAVNLDVFAEAGARFKAIQRSVVLSANSSGQIIIQSSATKDQAKIGAIVVN